ncbi:dTDP-4-dehydrorhamnose reductase [Actinoplanes sp. NBRC 14428]|uniref:dTDP-4-dehydrorhamnose reductase n=1 Tax=Pseudosporangium ferrugineum TaxID=439699 RepID=A0A2T0S274_9ACTN|nr:sugar nucleotide-binding protein [Pseudosporangium ferrugineum]PRY27519.1 dTDP-4-dehydrorhamnose reductase [Pseudosporangium ferrugineum]BCJ55718.1 dTDP-4-dehydrorhamnose reductase [Actinoplanes sp. NBRC 14428]
MRTLVVGASGHLGGEVARLASAAGAEVRGTATTRAGGWSPLDITDRAAVLALTASVRPQLIVNAAYRADSWPACADGAAHVALAAAESGARLVHVSTDAVHAGRPAPYGDDEPPTPVYTYGAAKAAGETAVRAIAPSAVVVRTSLIVGDTRSKQVRLSLDLATGRRRGALFTDEHRCPIDATDLATAILELAATDYTGLINVAGPDPLSRADLGRLIAAAHHLDPATVPTCTTAEAGLGPRPSHLLLDSTRATTLLKSPPRPVAETLTHNRHPSVD